MIRHFNFHLINLIFYFPSLRTCNHCQVPRYIATGNRLPRNILCFAQVHGFIDSCFFDHDIDERRSLCKLLEFQYSTRTAIFAIYHLTAPRIVFRPLPRHRLQITCSVCKSPHHFESFYLRALSFFCHSSFLFCEIKRTILVPF